MAGGELSCFIKYGEFFFLTSSEINVFSRRAVLHVFSCFKEECFSSLINPTHNRGVGDRGRVAQCLRCYATNRKVAGSIPAGVSGFFIEIKSFRSHCGPGVDSASNRNEYQEYFLGVKAAGA